MRKINLFVIALIFMPILNSCVKDNFNNELEESPNSNDLEITKLIIPENFKFETQQEVVVEINDNSTTSKYDVYAYNDELFAGETITYTTEDDETITETEYVSDVLNQLLFSGVIGSNGIKQSIAIPSYYTQLYIRRKDGLKYSSAIVTIENGKAVFNYTSTTGKSGKTSIKDYLFSVNGLGELLQIDPLDGTKTLVSTMPMGGYSVAIDEANKLLYAVGKKSPYPLMKYDIENDSWSTIADMGSNFAQLCFNKFDGLLYYAKGKRLYSLDPVNGQNLTTANILEFDNSGGGDIVVSSEGDFYMTTYSGLFKLVNNGSGDYISTRISAENLPFQPTSITFDSNNELWLADNGIDANLIVMDTQTGGWEYVYGTAANNNTAINTPLNDLATLSIYTDEPACADSDNDGVTDCEDKYPMDPNKAFELYTPSKYGYGTVAFEDLWPFAGDYDFNDVAINYRATAVQNSSNLVVQLDFNITVTSNGASFINAFGIEMENLNPNMIASVTGPIYSENYIVNNPNGTEANQEKAVIVFYDNNYNVLQTPMIISIVFTEPVTTEALGAAPFNPFIIVNSEREKEIHLPFAHTTSLGLKENTLEGNNKDMDGNYVTDQGLPWAINIVHNFSVPKEKTPVNEAYLYFNDWASSGGVTKSDWYKDGDGYRNTNLLKE